MIAISGVPPSILLDKTCIASSQGVYCISIWCVRPAAALWWVSVSNQSDCNSDSLCSTWSWTHSSLSIRASRLGWGHDCYYPTLYRIVWGSLLDSELHYPGNGVSATESTHFFSAGINRLFHYHFPSKPKLEKTGAVTCYIYIERGRVWIKSLDRTGYTNSPPEYWETFTGKMDII